MVVTGSLNCNTFNELYAQIKDFLTVTSLLPIGEVTDKIQSVQHPGEELGSVSVLEVIPKLSFANRLMLLSHLVLNDMFGVKYLTIYDWGYWIDYDGIKHVIPYGIKNTHAIESDILQTYNVCGVSPSISVLGACCHDLSLVYIRDKFIAAIKAYQKSVQIYAPTDIAKWSEFDRILRKGSRSLQQFIR